MIDSSPETLKQQVLINHFINATGCQFDQARQLLKSARWEFEAALSEFFQDTSVAANQRQYSGMNQRMCPPPCNTPATPPSFGDAMLHLQKLSTNDWQNAQSPPSSISVTNAVKVLTVCNFRHSPCDRYGTNCDWPMEIDLSKDLLLSGATGNMSQSGDANSGMVSENTDIPILQRQ